MSVAFAPWSTSQLRTVRRGHSWIAGEHVAVGSKSYQRGPMYVEWEAPERVARHCPIVLVHGGGFQGTEWLDTPYGGPDWAQRLVEAGYATLVVDRLGNGRSPLLTHAVGPMSLTFFYEGGRQITFPPDPPDPPGLHTQWPFAPDDEAAMHQFKAGYGPLPADLEKWEVMGADWLARLLDRIGPAVLLTHSASRPSGWLTAERRPQLVKAIVSVEPVGPPLVDIPNIGALRWGLASAPFTFDPARMTPQEVHKADPLTLCLPHRAGLPLAVVSGSTSAFAPASAPIVATLQNGGASAGLLHVPDLGINGNSHGPIYEKKSDAALQPVLAWLAHQSDELSTQGHHS